MWGWQYAGTMLDGEFSSARKCTPSLSYPNPHMKQRSPTIEGFRAMFRRPAVGLAEIAWRWSFGGAGALLLSFSFLEYLNTLPVTKRDLLFVRSGQPGLMSQAFSHILRGSGSRAAGALFVLGLAMAVAWMAVSVLGRSITMKALLSYFHEQDMMVFPEPVARGTGSLLGLNFLRLAATLAAIIGLVAAWTFGAAVSRADDPSPGSAFLIFLTVLMLVALAWSMVNWFLSFAAVFAIADGQDAFGAIGAAADLCRARSGPVLAASFWFGLAHVAAFVIASSVVAFPLAFAAVLPVGVVLGGVLLVTLLYFAVADFLYVGRLAAYVAIAEIPETFALPEVRASPGGSSAPPAGTGGTRNGAVDAGELILSDHPSSLEM